VWGRHSRFRAAASVQLLESQAGYGGSKSLAVKLKPFGEQDLLKPLFLNEIKLGPKPRRIGDDVLGDPDPKHISTSYVERLNWSLRTSMRRYTRLSNGFSRKLRNHEAAVSFNYFAYNFVRIHRTLRTSPAMAAAVTDRLWDVSDIVALLEAREAQRAA